MDLATVLQEVDSWSVEERLRLVEAVWDGIVETSAPELSQAQRRELDRRLAALEADPNDVVSWETVRHHIRRPR